MEDLPHQLQSQHKETTEEMLLHHLLLAAVVVAVLWLLAQTPQHLLVALV
jgi:hypothetical protein